MEVIAVSEEQISEGLKLVKTNCFACHNPEAGVRSRLAPPMHAVRKHYLDEGTTLEEFSNELKDFVLNPSNEKSKMPGAVEKFGLMPRMNFTEEQLENIAAYIFTTEMNKPGWQKQHQERKQNRTQGSHNENIKSLAKKGQEYALATKAVLGKNLMSAINREGTDGALQFCNTRAIHLTDSMAAAQEVFIKRVSDQPRNPENQARGSELDYIFKTKATLSAGNEAVPEIIEDDELITAYYPILTNQMCLQCHGKIGEQVKLSTSRLINDLYPEDEATGYNVNELRGIWVVNFKK